MLTEVENTESTGSNLLHAQGFVIKSVRLRNSFLTKRRGYENISNLEYDLRRVKMRIKEILLQNFSH